MRSVCFYHADCIDGLASYWVAKQALPSILGEAVVYNTPPRWDAIDDQTHLFILDFSFNFEQMQELIHRCAKVTLIDHHPDTKDLVAKLNTWLLTSGLTHKAQLIYTDHDAGTLLTWYHFFPGQEPAVLLKAISDRDTWQFARPDTRQIMAGFMTYPLDYEILDQMLHLSEDELIPRLMLEGDTALRTQATQIAWAMKETYREIDFEGIRVPLLQLPKYLASDALNALVRKGAWKVALSYYDDPHGRVYSIRTHPSVDAREYARPYGGSGHATASGFRVPFGHPLTQV